VKAPKVRRSWVEPEQALSLLDGASAYMRPVVATLLGAGLRVSEAVALDWSDVNLATGTLRTGKAKTDGGTYREVDLPGGLVDELTEWKMRSAGELERWNAEHPGGGRPRVPERPRRPHPAPVCRQRRPSAQDDDQGCQQAAREARH
jgi:integrase